jgi:hypothetical protein
VVRGNDENCLEEVLEERRKDEKDVGRNGVNAAIVHCVKYDEIR